MVDAGGSGEFFGIEGRGGGGEGGQAGYCAVVMGMGAGWSVVGGDFDSVLCA